MIFNYHGYIDKASIDSGNMYEIFKKCCEIFKRAIVYDINRLVVAKTLFEKCTAYLKKCVAEKKTSILVKRSVCVCGCYNVELICNVMTVLFFYFYYQQISS